MEDVSGYCRFLGSLTDKVQVIGTQDAASQLVPAKVRIMTRLLADKSYDVAKTDYINSVIPCQWLLQSLLGTRDPRYIEQKKMLRSLPGVSEFTGKKWSKQSMVYKYVENPYACLLMGMRDTNMTTVILMFRGARPGTDQQRALNWRRTRVKDIDTARSVHRGISKTFWDTWPTAYREVQKMIKTINGPMQIIVSGLSFGACLATLAAVDLVKRYPGKVNVITFGGQRVGTRKFHDRLMQQDMRFNNFLRIYNTDDALVHIPPRFLGFYHMDEYLLEHNIHIANYDAINLQQRLPVDIQQTVNQKGDMNNRKTFWHTAYSFKGSQGVLVLQSPCSGLHSPGALSAKLIS